MGVTDRVRTGRCNLELFRGGLKVNHNIGNLQSGLQRNRTDSMDYFLSKTSRIAEARFRAPMGFSMYLRTPRASAFSADILSL